jgi:hypothetical protein
MLDKACLLIQKVCAADSLEALNISVFRAVLDWLSNCNVVLKIATDFRGGV